MKFNLRFETNDIISKIVNSNPQEVSVIVKSLCESFEIGKLEPLRYLLKTPEKVLKLTAKDSLKVKLKQWATYLAAIISAASTIIGGILSISIGKH